MDSKQKRAVRQRAQNIRKAQTGKLTTKDYLQRGLVVLIILVILATAMFIYQNIR